MLFVVLLIGVILIVGGLTFFPALALGPIADHLALFAGRTVVGDRGTTEALPVERVVEMVRASRSGR